MLNTTKGFGRALSAHPYIVIALPEKHVINQVQFLNKDSLISQTIRLTALCGKSFILAAKSPIGSHQLYRLSYLLHISLINIKLFAAEAIHM